MAEKWSADTEWTDDGRRWMRVALNGEPLPTIEVVEVLHALEADKAALLEALENLNLTYCGGCDQCWVCRYITPLISRIRSEGAEVKAGE